MQAIESAFGLIDIGLAKGGAEIFETEPVRSEGRGIRLNANGGALAAANADESDSGKLRNFLSQSGVGEVLDLGQRKSRGSERKGHDGRVSRIDLAVDGRIGKTLREEIGSAIDGGLNSLLRDVNAQVQTELESDKRATEGARRCHLVQAGNLAKLALKGRGDRGSHYLRTGAGIER